MRLAAIAVLVPLLCAGPVIAGSEDDLQAGVDAYNQGDFVSARNRLIAAVEQGNPEAMVDLGYMYARGHAVERDSDHALQLYRRAAEAGDAEGMNALGFRDDIASPPNHVAAVRWYCMSVLRGNARAMNNLGILFANGQGVPQDVAEARSLWRQAAERGHLNGQSNLGESLLSDTSLPDAPRREGLR